MFSVYRSFSLVNSKLIMQGMRKLAKESEVSAELYDIVTSLNLIKLQHWASVGILNYANGKLYIQLSSTWKHPDIEGSFSYSEVKVYCTIYFQEILSPQRLDPIPFILLVLEERKGILNKEIFIF